ncbi:MAG: hypothetical protein CVU29_00290 [Betaproteobacteria bacterium HGW-Betaproteobacteria-22]|nr:MAG: hypothetical protein CVU29_00290 [Betaproteobacteria bacterium HGW-Betaproteobacteria-22]
MRFCLSVLVFIFSVPVHAAMDDINRIYRQQPVLKGFDVCLGGGCAEVRRVAIPDAEWQRVVRLFEGVDGNAERERRQIAAAIGELERIVGAKIGTEADRAGTFGNAGFSNQQDCNDEAINSTSYMRLMREAGLMQLHAIEDMRTRNFFFSGWPHSTAVIHEIKTGQRYAVDSWFYDNGFPATIVPFALWKSGYIPEDSPVVKPSTNGKR